MENAKLVLDYPYGGFRCQIKFWLEKSDKNGFRFCSQTQNPKTGRWNNPKHSTYSKFAGAMFLDENNHVHWVGLSEYDDANKVLSFVKDFPKADFSLLRDWCLMKAIYCAGRAKGKTPYPATTEEDIAKVLQEEKVWRESANLIKINEAASP